MPDIILFSTYLGRYLYALPWVLAQVPLYLCLKPQPSGSNTVLCPKSQPCNGMPALSLPVPARSRPFTPVSGVYKQYFPPSRTRLLWDYRWLTGRWARWLLGSIAWLSPLRALRLVRPALAERQLRYQVHGPRADVVPASCTQYLLALCQLAARSGTMSASRSHDRGRLLLLLLADWTDLVSSTTFSCSVLFFLLPFSGFPSAVELKTANKRKKERE